jgi:hypothetical protein
MKKLLILSVLLGLMALPMFASDFSFGGDVTFGFIGDFGDNEAEKFDATFDIMATIDDYNSLTINTDGLETANWAGITKILVSTDVGALLGLPVGVVVNWGWDDPDMNEFQNISDYGNEDPWDFSSPSGEYAGLDFLVSYEFIEVEFAFNPGGTVTGVNAGDLLVGLAVKEPIEGMNAEVYYYQNESAIDEYGEGRIGFDAAYAGDFGGFGVEAGAYFGYDLLDTAADAWAYGVGLKGAYSIATVTVGLAGDETDTLDNVSATVAVAPIDLLDIYAGIWYSMALEDLAEVDLGVNAHLGAVEMYLGYLVDGEIGLAGDNFHSPTGLAGGESGAYVLFDVNY